MSCLGENLIAAWTGNRRRRGKKSGRIRHEELISTLSAILCYLIFIGRIEAFQYQSSCSSCVVAPIRQQCFKRVPLSSFGRVDYHPHDNYLNYHNYYDHDRYEHDGRRRTSLASLLSASDTWSNVAALSSLATVAQSPWLNRNVAVVRLLGAPVSAMAMAFVLASAGVLPPGGSAGARALQGLSLQLATPLMLLGAEIRFTTLKKRCGALLNSFLLASVATTVACVVAIRFLGSSLFSSMGGNDGFKIAAALLGKNIGGGINYMAIASSLQATPPAIAAGLCVDNIFALIYFPITSALSSGRTDLVETNNKNNNTHHIIPQDTHLPTPTIQSITTQSVSTVLSLAALFIALGDRVGGPSASIPICTLLTVIFTMTFPESFLKSIRPAADTLGTTLLYMFFATAGAPGLSLASSTLRKSFVPLTLYLSLLYSVHGGILCLARFISTKRRTNQVNDEGMMAPQRLLVASSAAIGGPATAAALAQANGWESLIVPSLLVGNLGYAIATFIGIAFYSIFSSSI